MTQDQLTRLEIVQKRQERRAQKRERREEFRRIADVLDLIHKSREHWKEDEMWPFERSALHRDQMDSEDSRFLANMEKARREKAQEGLREQKVSHVYNAVRYSFEDASDPKKSEAEKLDAMRTIVQTALLMAEISGADRRTMIQDLVDFCAEEMPLADIKKAYTKQLVARKPLLSPSDLERLGERTHD